MTMYAEVKLIFIVYLFMKALIFAPLTFVALMISWLDK